MAIYYDGYDWDSDGFPGEFVYGDLGCGDDYYMDERWKRVWNLPDYWVSNKERVWSSVKERFLDGSPVGNGYIDFTLYNNGRKHRRYLHRLMAEAFIPNPYNYPNVRHLDDNPCNNELDNLAWGTQLDNVHDCIRNGHFRYLTKDDIAKANDIRRAPVVAIRLKDGKTVSFLSQQEAARKLNIDQSCICAVLQGKSNSAGGYYFVHQDEFDESFDYKNHTYQKRGLPVKATNLLTGETRFYDKPRHAAFDLSMSEASVSNVLRGKMRSAKGWLFEEKYTGDF